MKYATLLLGLAIALALAATAHAQVPPGPNITHGVPFTFSPRYGVFPRRPPSHLGGWPAVPAFALPFAPPPPPVVGPPPPPAPAPLGWVFTRYTVCPEPAVCPVVFVSVGADGLNVRVAGPDSPPTMALVNGTPLQVLDRQGSWTLVAPACELVPTGVWSWTAGVPLNRCWMY